MASDFERRPPLERGHPVDASARVRPPRRSQVLHPEPGRADGHAVSPFGNDVDALDDYLEPDDFADDYANDVDGLGRSYYYDDSAPAVSPDHVGPGTNGTGSRTANGTANSRADSTANGAGQHPLEADYSGEDRELDYEDYFDDDDDAEEILDQTSAITRNALEWAVVLVGAVLVALLLRASLFQAFYIPSESMENTLLVDDRVLVNKVSYRLHDVNRGDIVVFMRPDDQQGPIRDLIKRVIALPGETVEARDNVIFINDQRLIEPYLEVDAVTSDFGPTVVPEGEIFVMGDNRSESFDSRGFGAIEEDRVIGRAFVLFWPLNRIGSL